MSTADTLLAALAAEPWRYDFFHALRLIEAAHPAQPRLGTARRPQDEPVRLGQSPDLSFAPATLHAVLPRSAHRPPRIDVRFLGLFGPNGPLPLHLTEYARERELHHGDETFTRFADLFHHRLLLLFYRAWAQAQPAVSLDRPGDDRFAALVGSLIGIGSPALQRRDAVHDHVKLHFAGVFTRQSRSAEGLAALLGGMLGRTVQVEQFAGAWLPLQAGERTRIGRLRGGRRNLGARLGAGAVLGATVWDRQHHFVLHIGPLDHTAFAALLPGGQVLPALVALVKQYVGEEFGWSMRLALQAQDIRPARLGRHGRLGWDCWLRQPGRGGLAHMRLPPAEALRSLHRRQMTENHRSASPTESTEV
ncbi:type VI secretion system baseplate subunit TssG [Aquincola sp. MAHUQ-54]|uniref:Type VI secretion system baseplate subunit TssG n=1 Tax=Aquincola agrisoli TaxID=3119538 RepID=A0AAW9Q2S3_9BURK